MKRIGALLVLGFCVVPLTSSAQDAPRELAPHCEPGEYNFKGRVSLGQTFSRKFGGFVFTLVPGSEGDWHIQISQGQRHGLELMTGPRHFVPNPVDIEGWHFRNATNSGPNTGDVNAPDETRQFLFSPRWPRCEDSDLTRDGRGTLEITDMELRNLKPGEKATMTMMEFKVRLQVGRSACEAACPQH